MNEETDSILYWKQRLEDMTRRWDARVHEVHLLRQDMDKRIAEAVVAEREACARIAKSYGGPEAPMMVGTYEAGWFNAAEAIAADIRARSEA